MSNIMFLQLPNPTDTCLVFTWITKTFDVLSVKYTSLEMYDAYVSIYPTTRPRWNQKIVQVK